MALKETHAHPTLGCRHALLGYLKSQENVSSCGAPLISVLQYNEIPRECVIMWHPIDLSVKV